MKPRTIVWRMKVRIWGRKTINGSRFFIFWLPHCVFMCVCLWVCSTCRGRLSMRQQHPNMSSSRLVRMKALMELVNFWILGSLFGPLVFLMGAQTEVFYYYVLWNVILKYQDITVYRSVAWKHCDIILRQYWPRKNVLLLRAWDDLLLFTLLHLPVHDVSNQRTCDQTQQLQRAEDGRVETHWRGNTFDQIKKDKSEHMQDKLL